MDNFGFVTCIFDALEVFAPSQIHHRGEGACPPCPYPSFQHATDYEKLFCLVFPMPADIIYVEVVTNFSTCQPVTPCLDR